MNASSRIRRVFFLYEKMSSSLHFHNARKTCQAFQQKASYKKKKLWTFEKKKYLNILSTDLKVLRGRYLMNDICILISEKKNFLYFWSCKSRLTWNKKENTNNSWNWSPKSVKMMPAIFQGFLKFLLSKQPKKKRDVRSRVSE